MANTVEVQVAERKKLRHNMTVQVLVAILLGIAVGFVFPEFGKSMKVLGDAFIRLVKMVVGPIVFLTIVVGIAGMGDLKKVGRVGGKALIYFEVMTTLALAIGLIVANWVGPGRGFDRSKVDATGTAAKVDSYVAKAKGQGSTADWLLHVIPDNAVGAFAGGDLLQVLFFAVIVGFAVAALGSKGERVISIFEDLTEVMFKVVAIIMRVAPIGAFGAMAYTIGEHGLKVLVVLGQLMACVYITMAVFIFVVLGVTCRMFGFSLWKLLSWIRSEILLVLGTSSSESALPRMIEKLEAAGCGRSVVRLVIPTGYSFNLDGTSIYLSMAVLFIAQAFGVEMSFWEQARVLGILMLTSKGAAAVTGGGFITLAATLSASHPELVPGIFLVLGVDRFMSEARAITNLIGNGVATVVVAKWEGEYEDRGVL